VITRATIAEPVVVKREGTDWCTGLSTTMSY
jgi:hypothetical protein